MTTLEAGDIIERHTVEVAEVVDVVNGVAYARALNGAFFSVDPDLGWIAARDVDNVSDGAVIFDAHNTAWQLVDGNWRKVGSTVKAPLSFVTSSGPVRVLYMGDEK